MAMEVHAFGAHIGGWGVLAQVDEAVDRLLERGRQHVVGVVAEAVVPQPDVRRIGENSVSPSTQFLHPNVLDPCFWQGFFERLTIEIRKPARPGERSNVY